MKGASTLDSLPRWDGPADARGVCLVFDDDDRVQNVRFALDLNRPLAGLLTVDVTPGNRKTYELAKDVLAGLGKRVDISGASPTSHETWFRACAWMTGERIRDIFVCRAHLVDGYRLRRLIELAAIADARLWLLMHRPSLNRGQKEVARDWGIATMRFPEFRRLWKSALPPKQVAPEPQRALPTVPDEEFPTFLACSKTLLSAEQFRRVSGMYWAAHAQTLEWFDGHTGRQGDPVTEGAITEFLHTLLAPCAGLTERVVCGRASQAACFLRGWLLKLDAKALAGAYLAAPLSTLDEEAANTVRLYEHPRYAAAAVIALASREPASALVAVDVTDVEADGSALRVAGRRVEVPNAARGIIRALLAFRLSEGAGPDDPLFVSEKRIRGGRDGRAFARTTANGLRGRLTTVAIETGLFVVAPENYGESDPKRWLRRQGLTVKRLDSGESSP